MDDKEIDQFLSERECYTCKVMRNLILAQEIAVTRALNRCLKWGLIFSKRQ